MPKRIICIPCGDSSGDYAGNFLTLRYVSVNENLNEQNVQVKAICRVNIPNEVKFIRFAIPGKFKFCSCFL